MMNFILNNIKFTSSPETLQSKLPLSENDIGSFYYLSSNERYGKLDLYYQDGWIEGNSSGDDNIDNVLIDSTNGYSIPKKEFLTPYISTKIADLFADISSENKNISRFNLKVYGDMLLKLTKKEREDFFIIYEIVMNQLNLVNKNT